LDIVERREIDWPTREMQKKETHKRMGHAQALNLLISVCEEPMFGSFSSPKAALAGLVIWCQMD
jgi:hypothetical protein